MYSSTTVATPLECYRSVGLFQKIHVVARLSLVLRARIPQRLGSRIESQGTQKLFQRTRYKTPCLVLLPLRHQSNATDPLDSSRRYTLSRDYLSFSEPEYHSGSDRGWNHKEHKNSSNVPAIKQHVKFSYRCDTNQMLKIHWVVPEDTRCRETFSRSQSLNTTAAQIADEITRNTKALPTYRL